ncbi:MAG: hypothetical protein HY700_05000 [Gemmatimonadetes bacterium]|nr:hypothetical protein [Gemmatimonadota bacterium]
MRTGSLSAAVLLAAAVACAPPQSAAPPKNVMVIGIDVSGSFRASHYQDAIDFAAYYIYGHMRGLGGLRQPTAVFVGSVGGEALDEVKSFHPIHDFEGKSVEQIRADLQTWFPPNDRLTDYNAFFDRIATLVKRQNLVLAPLNILVLTDGIPDLMRRAGKDSASAYASLKVDALEFLSRNVTVRLLYPTPTVAVGWERGLKRDRVRLWTLDAQVMEGWRAQVSADLPADAQSRLWRWMDDNVDFRVRSSIL